MEQVATNGEDANGCDSSYESESESASAKQRELGPGEEQRVQEPMTGEELGPARENEADQELLNERSSPEPVPAWENEAERAHGSAPPRECERESEWERDP